VAVAKTIRLVCFIFIFLWIVEENDSLMKKQKF